MNHNSFFVQLFNIKAYTTIEGEYMNNYKEIVTKAIIGKLKKNSIDNISFNIDDKPDTILGCWIINHNFNGILNNKDVLVNGKYDINVWYSYDNNTKTNVAKYTYNYNDILNININDNIESSDVKVRSLTNPVVNDAKIEDNTIKLEVSKELATEVIADTTIKVPIESTTDDYIEIKEDIKDEEINTNYLDK
jgi:spore coat protein E